MVLAGFTEVYGSGALVLEKVKASAEIVAMLLKSWSGEIAGTFRPISTLGTKHADFRRQGSSISTSTGGKP